MKHLFVSIFILSQLNVMPQSTFKQTLGLLYFNVDVSNNSADTVISSLQKEKALIQQERVALSTSLPTALAMHTGRVAEKKTYIFKMLRSPLANIKIDSGYIKIVIGEIDNKKKVLDFEWCVILNDKTDAESSFEELKRLFMPVSTKHHFEDDEELEYAKYAEFSTRKKLKRDIRDITIFLSSIKGSSGYEIRVLPYNEFMEE